MRTWTRSSSVRTLTALVAAGGIVAAGTGTASADLIVNGLDDSIDTTVEVMPLSLSTGPGETTVYVVPAEGDGDPGCNFDGASETVSVNIAVDNPAVATVSPSTLTLTGCGAAAAKKVTVTPVGVGTAVFTTTVAAGTNDTGGTFSIANARFSARVTAVPNTPPTVDIVGVEEGGAYARGTLQRPNCVATDPDDVPTPPHTKTWPAPLTEISGPYAVDNLGTRYAQCSYVDGAGVQVLARKGFSIVDETAPGIGRVLDPVADGSGWFRADVSLRWNVTEAQSPSSLKTVGCEDELIAVDTALTTFTCTATSAGGRNEAVVNVRRDATAPTVSPTTTLVGGGTAVNGWHTSPVGVTFTATDETSLFLVDGRASRTSSQTTTTTRDGEQVVESPAFTDRAGNASAVGAVKRTVKVDTKAPSAPTASLSTPGGTTGWHTAPVTITFHGAGDEGSGVASCTPAVPVDVDTEGRTVSGTCTDNAGHTSAPTAVTVKLDRGKPVVTQAVVAAAPTGKDSWYTTDVEVDFTATDAVSGIESATQRVKSSGEGAAVEVSSPAFTDRAGNTTAAGALRKTFKVDRTAPAVPTFVGGPSSSHYFGEVPGAPTCTSSDTGSGLASCTVEGYSTAVGPHTLTARATDNAGHTSTATHTYVVKSWTTSGFAHPVDMGTTTNSVKGGNTVPVKFELFAGATELTAVDNASFTAVKTTCDSGTTLDEIEVLGSGSTSLRYDTTAGNYHYNWKTPSGAGCYSLTMLAKDGKTTAVARFRTK